MPLVREAAQHLAAAGRDRAAPTPQREGTLHRLYQPRAALSLHLEAILHHIIHRVWRSLQRIRHRLIRAQEHPIDQHTQIPLLLQKAKELLHRSPLRRGINRKDEQHCLLCQSLRDPLHDALGVVRLDLLPIHGVEPTSQPRKEELQVVVHLCQGAHGRARCADSVLLLDRDRRRDALDLIDRGLIHPVKKLPHIRRKRLYIPALPLRI